MPTTTPPEWSLSYHCCFCNRRWTITARVSRDDECPSCGTVRLPVKAEQISDWKVEP